MRKLKYTKETLYYGTKEYDDFKSEMSLGKEKELVYLITTEILKEVENEKSLKRKM